MGNRIPIKPPKTYDAASFTKIFNSIQKELSDNAVAKGLTDRINGLKRTLTALVEKESITKDIIGYITFNEWSSGGTEYATFRITITKGKGYFGSFEYRKSSVNIQDADVWTTVLHPSGTTTYWVPVAGWPGGGWWQVNIPWPESGWKEWAYQIEVRVLDAIGRVWITAHGTLDNNPTPSILNASLAIGAWTGSGWPLSLIGTADDDTGSIGWGWSGSAYAKDDDLDGSDGVNAIFDGAGLDFATSDKRFNVSVGTFSPSVPGGATVTVYVILRACKGAGQTGDKNTAYTRITKDMPLDPTDPTLIGTGSVLASQLAKASQRVAMEFDVIHGPTDEDDYVKVNSGLITYADTTVVNVTALEYSLLAGGLHYFYYDSASHATQLQVTTSATTAQTMTASGRVFVGVAKQATVSQGKAFFVFGGAAVAITAPYIYALSLESLTAQTGALNVSGLLTVGDNIVIDPDAFGAGFEGIIIDDGSYNRVQIGEITSGNYGIKIVDSGNLTVFESVGGGTTTFKNVNVDGAITVASGGSIAIGTSGLITNSTIAFGDEAGVYWYETLPSTTLIGHIKGYGVQGIVEIAGFNGAAFVKAITWGLFEEFTIKVNTIYAFTVGELAVTVDAALFESTEDSIISGTGKKVGFYGIAGTTIPDITGSRGSNAALASLLTALAAQGLITDSTT